MALTYDNEQRAAEVLAHYLKDRGSLTGDAGRQEGEEAARTIRAAFEALEEVTPRPGSDSKQPTSYEDQ